MRSWLLLPHGAFNVRVFGSVARGDYDDDLSDIDILVCLNSSGLEGMRYFGVLEQMNEELERLLGRKVDLIDETGLQEPLSEIQCHRIWCPCVHFYCTRLLESPKDTNAVTCSTAYGLQKVCKFLNRDQILVSPLNG